jgi:hypothetical protein
MVIVHRMLALEMLRYGKVMGYCQSEAAPHSPEPATCKEPPPPDGAVSSEQSSRIQESLFAPMVRLLVMFGARFPTVDQQTSFMQYADWMGKLYEDSLGLPSDGAQSNQEPRKLVNICRLAIRGHMAKVARLHCLSQLPLPGHLLNYVHINYM